MNKIELDFNLESTTPQALYNYAIALSLSHSQKAIDIFTQLITANNAASISNYRNSLTTLIDKETNSRHPFYNKCWRITEGHWDKDWMTVHNQENTSITCIYCKLDLEVMKICIGIPWPHYFFFQNKIKKIKSMKFA